MPEQVSILEIDPSWRRDVEDMGSKPKFWFRYQDAMWLFKRARKNTGEHWAEKVASEIAEEMGLPTHTVELALTPDGFTGCAVRSFLEKGQTLIHGNEVMAGAIPGYDKSKERGQADHHFSNIVTALETRFVDDRVRTHVSNRFVGYLVFDALVGNTDRHHENWAIIEHRFSRVGKDGFGELVLKKTLAHTFDHGSSLGREMLDERRRMILDDTNGLPRYIRKAKGGIFRDAKQKKGMAPIDLVRLIAEKYPAFFKPWQERIAVLPTDFVEPIVQRIPGDWMSKTSKEFALAFVAENRKLILEIE